MIIDTKNKTVQCDGETIEQVYDALKAMVPDWAEYRFTPKTITVTLKETEYVPNPFPFIPSPVYPMNPYYETNPFRITCEDTNNICNSNILYPSTMDSTGQALYGALANQPIKYHKFSV